MTVNKVILCGYLGRDPEMRTFPSGDQMANVSIATTERWKDKTTGEKKEATEWHRCVFNGKLAEIVGQYVKKGALLYVEGQLRTRKWTDQAGVEKYTTEIRVDEMKMLGGSRGQEGGDGASRSPTPAPAPAARPAARPAPAPARAPSGFDDMDDDIPF